MNILIVAAGVLLFLAFLLVRACAKAQVRAADAAAVRREVNAALAGAARVQEKNEIKRVGRLMAEAKLRGDDAESDRLRDESVVRMRSMHWRV